MSNATPSPAASPEGGAYAVTSGGNRRRRVKPTPAQLRRTRSAVMKRDEFTCQACGCTAEVPADYDGRYAPLTATGEWLELDHVTPYRHGGEFAEGNLQVLCSPCNRAKGPRAGRGVA